jgi:hypothetical protein
LRGNIGNFTFLTGREEWKSQIGDYYVRHSAPIDGGAVNFFGRENTELADMQSGIADLTGQKSVKLFYHA